MLWLATWRNISTGITGKSINNQHFITNNAFLREEGAEDEGRGRRKRRGASSAISKKRKRKSDDEEDESVKKSRREATEETSLLAPPAVVKESVPLPAETEETEDKLTEYEIFQKLQMKEQKTDRKRVSMHAYNASNLTQHC